MAKKTKKKKIRALLTRIFYLYFWMAAGVIAFLVMSLATDNWNTRVPYGILTGLLLSFLVYVQKYRRRPAYFSLLCAAAAGMIFCAAFDLRAFWYTLFSFGLFTVCSYPFWRWLVRPDLQPTAARWFLYFVLLMLGYMAQASSRFLYTILLLLLILAVHLGINGVFLPFTSSPDAKDVKGIPKRPSGLPAANSLSNLMLERAKRKALRQQAVRMVQRSAAKEEEKPSAHLHASEEIPNNHETLI